MPDSLPGAEGTRWPRLTNKETDINKYTNKMMWGKYTAPQCFPVALIPPSQAVGSLLPGWLPGDQRPVPRVLGSSGTMSPVLTFSLSEKLAFSSFRAGRRGLNLQTLQEIRENNNVLSCYCKESEEYKVGEVSILIQPEGSFPARNGFTQFPGWCLIRT